MPQKLERNTGNEGTMRPNPPSGLYMVISRGEESTVEILLQGDSVLQMIRRLRSMHIDDALRLAHAVQGLLDAKLTDPIGQDGATAEAGDRDDTQADAHSQRVSNSDASITRRELIFDHHDAISRLNRPSTQPSLAAVHHDSEVADELSLVQPKGAPRMPELRGTAPLEPLERIDFSNFHNFHGPCLSTSEQPAPESASVLVLAPFVQTSQPQMTLAGYRASNPTALRYTESRADNAISRVHRTNGARMCVVAQLKQEFLAAQTQITGLINIREAFERVTDGAVDEEERIRIEQIEAAAKERWRGQEQRIY